MGLKEDEPGSSKYWTDGGAESWTANSAVLGGACRLGQPFGMLQSQQGSIQDPSIIAGVASYVETQK